MPVTTRHVAHGCRHRGMMEVTVGFDDDTFAEIRRRAIAQGISFSEAVRQFVEWGLEVDEDA